MAKKVTKQLKLVIAAGKANPAPPVGPALGQAGINIGEFVKQFNDATKDKMGELVPVVISVYEDRTFSFVQKTAPASSLILKAIGADKGSGTNKTKKAGKLSKYSKCAENGILVCPKLIVFFFVDFKPHLGMK